MESPTLESKKPFETTSFEAPPPEIPKEAITEVVTSEVVVAGAGLAGMCAALSAAQAGVRVIVLEKGQHPMFHGARHAAVGSRLQKSLGIEIDKGEIIAEMMRWSGYQADQRLLKLWVDESGPAMDWILDMVEAAGFSITMDVVSRKGDRYKHYPTSHVMPRLKADKIKPGNATLMQILEENALKAGIEFRFQTPIMQLIREGESVSGVIAKSQQGFIQFNARAVILCTGGYENSPDMLMKYIPRALNAAVCWYAPPLTTGDGHKIGLWVGAAMDEAPHCPIFFDGGIPGTFLPLALARQPFLNVNILGERYMDEDAPFNFIANADLQQPGHVKWSVWDDKWEEEVSQFEGIICKKMVPPLHTPEIVEMALNRGFIISADTLPDLAQKMAVPASTFLTTVKRYNELARNGEDLDFGKHASRLTTIEKPPFYAARMGAALLATQSGLKVNLKMEVLDRQWKVIPGLYAAGNVSGGFFANDYPITVPGLSHGRAFTFGRLAGLNAAVKTAE